MYGTEIALAVNASAYAKMRNELQAMAGGTGEEREIAQAFLDPDYHHQITGSHVFYWACVDAQSSHLANYLRYLHGILDRRSYYEVHVGDEPDDVSLYGAWRSNPFGLGVSRRIVVAA